MKKVLCIPEINVPLNKNGRHINGYEPIGSVMSDLFFFFETCEFVEIERYIAEKDVRYKQVIPYVVINMGGTTLTYCRSKSGGESRLHSKYSIGFGGHIDSEDVVYARKLLYPLRIMNQDIEREAYVMSIFVAAKREIKEEIGIDVEHSDFRISGFLYDPSDDVGKVHIGIVMELLLKNDIMLHPNEEIGYMDWRTNSELIDLDSENWTKLILNCQNNC